MTAYENSGIGLKGNSPIQPVAKGTKVKKNSHIPFK